MSSISRRPVRYPVEVDLAGQPVLVVGGGAVARRKVLGLLDAGALVTVLAPAVAPALAALDVTLEVRPYAEGDAARGYRLVLAATSSPTVNRAVRDDAVAAGVWVSVADDPAGSTFTSPAAVRRGDVLLTASTGGTSPALAAWLRDRLAEAFGPELAVVAEAVGERRRALQADGHPTDDVDWAAVIEDELRRARGPAVEG